MNSALQAACEIDRLLLITPSTRVLFRGFAVPAMARVLAFATYRPGMLGMLNASRICPALCGLFSSSENTAAAAVNTQP